MLKLLIHFLGGKENKLDKLCIFLVAHQYSSNVLNSEEGHGLNPEQLVCNCLRGGGKRRQGIGRDSYEKASKTILLIILFTEDL